MNYADIKEMDVANGPGIRMSLFVSGCNHRCKGCFNEVAWDFNYGKPFTKIEEDYMLNYLSGKHIAGLTILGGEPLERVNQQGLLPLVKRIKSELPDKTIWCFTGFDFTDNVLNHMYKEWPETRELLSYIDVIVDGKFIEELKDLTLRFKGSSNQRTIMVQETLGSGDIILWDSTQN